MTHSIWRGSFTSLGLSVLASALAATACSDSRTPVKENTPSGGPGQPGDHREDTGDDDPGPGNAPWMATQVLTPVVEAGSEAEVLCLQLSATAAEAVAPGAEVVLSADDEEVFTADQEGSARFLVTRAGVFTAFCRSQQSELVDEIGDHLTVTAGAAHTWDPNFAEQTCHARDVPLPFHATVYDRFDNPLESPQFALRTEPETTISRPTPRTFGLGEEGDFELVWEAAGRISEDAQLKPFRVQIHVDDTAPEIVIVEPALGAMLLGGTMEDGAVFVEGVAIDGTSAIEAVAVNNGAVDISGGKQEEAFSAAVVSRWGLSVVSAEAVDICGNVSSASRALFRSPSYYEAALEPSAEAAVLPAVAFHVKQPMIDDRDRSTVDELATLMEILAANIDLSTFIQPGMVLVQKPVRDSCRFVSPWIDLGYEGGRHPDAGLDLLISDLRFSGAAAVSGGLSFDTSLERLSVPLSITLQLRECALGIMLEQKATLQGSVDLDGVELSGLIGINLDGDTPTLDLDHVTVDTQAASVDFDYGFLDLICLGGRCLGDAFDWAADALLGIGWLREIAEKVVMEILANQVAPALAETVSQLRLELPLTLPPPLDTELIVSTGLERIMFCGAASALATPANCPQEHPTPGFAVAGLAAQFYPPARGVSIPEDNYFGSIRYAPTVGFVDQAQSDFIAGVNLDAINQALWAFWYGDGFDRELGPIALALGFEWPEGIEARISAPLPPVVMPGRGGAMLEVGVGDLYLELTIHGPGDGGEVITSVMPTGELPSVGLQVSAILGVIVDLDVAAGTLRMSLAPDFELYGTIANSNDPEAEPGDVNRLLDALAEQIRANIDLFAFEMPVPEVDLGLLSEATSGIIWYLEEGLAASQAGFVTLDGRIGVRSDAPAP